MSDLPLLGAPLLSAHDMARFAARGFLRMDAVVPPEINAQFLSEVGDIGPPEPGRKMRRTYGELLANAGVPEVGAGVPLARVYPQGSAMARLLALPVVAGAIRSLVGDDPVFDHHFLLVKSPATTAATNDPSRRRALELPSALRESLGLFRDIGHVSREFVRPRSKVTRSRGYSSSVEPWARDPSERILLFPIREPTDES